MPASSHIQVVSFVNPKVEPQLTGVADLGTTLPECPAGIYSALVLNMTNLDLTT